MSGGAAKLDDIDRQIIAILSRDGRMPVSTLAERVGLTAAPVQVRVRRLERDGVISGYRAVIDPIRAGWAILGFAELRVEDRGPEARQAVEAALADLPWVVEAHQLTGDHDFLLKLAAPDMASLNEGLGPAFDQLPHRVTTRISVATRVLRHAGEDWPSPPK